MSWLAKQLETKFYIFPSVYLLTSGCFYRLPRVCFRSLSSSHPVSLSLSALPPCEPVPACDMFVVLALILVLSTPLQNVTRIRMTFQRPFPFVLSFFSSFVLVFACSLVGCFVPSFIRSFVGSFVLSLVGWLLAWFVRSFVVQMPFWFHSEPKSSRLHKNNKLCN